MSMLNCAECQAGVWEWRDGTLTPSAQKETARHLEVCPACREVFARESALGGELAQALRARTQAVAFTADARRRVLASVGAREGTTGAGANSGTRTWPRWAAVAALLMLVCGGLWWRGHDAPPAALPPPVNVVAPAHPEEVMYCETALPSLRTATEQQDASNVVIHLVREVRRELVYSRRNGTEQYLRASVVLRD